VRNCCKTAQQKEAESARQQGITVKNDNQDSATRLGEKMRTGCHASSVKSGALPDQGAP